MMLSNRSSRGPGAYGDMIKPELVAAGVQVYTTTLEGYGLVTGTSVAAPHVAGTAALILSANPQIPIEDMETILKHTAIALTSEQYPNTPNYGLVIEKNNSFIFVDISLSPEDGEARITPIEPYLPGENYNLKIFLDNSNRYIMRFNTQIDN